MAGPVAGVVQIGRGAAHTPEAIAASSKGKQWDSEKRKWIDYSLPDEAAEVGETHAAIGVEESDMYLPPLPTDVAVAMSSTTA